MKLIKNLLILSTLAASSAFAASAGFYAGVSAGYASLKPTNYTVDGTNLVTFSNRNGMSYGLQLGYNLNQYIGLEATYNKLPNLDANINIPDAATGKYSFSPHEYSLSVVGYYPINNQFDLVGKAGYARISYSGMGYKDKAHTPVVALGAQYNLQKNMSLQATYTYYLKKSNIEDYVEKGTKYTPNVGIINLSFNYNFNSMM